MQRRESGRRAGPSPCAQTMRGLRREAAARSGGGPLCASEAPRPCGVAQRPLSPRVLYPNARASMCAAALAGRASVADTGSLARVRASATGRGTHLIHGNPRLVVRDGHGHGHGRHNDSGAHHLVQLLCDAKQFAGAALRFARRAPAGAPAMACIEPRSGTLLFLLALPRPPSSPLPPPVPTAPVRCRSRPPSAGPGQCARGPRRRRHTLGCRCLRPPLSSPSSRGR